MHIKNLVFLAMTVAGGASADARYSTNNAPPNGLIGIQLAQIQMSDISDSDLRRLSFYANRATGALRNIVVGAEARSIIEQDKVNKRFREAVSRLANAGARSGLSIDQVADFFTQEVFDEFGQSFMQQVGAVAGGLDFRTLFRNVATVPDPRTNVGDSGADFLGALAQASRGLDLSTPLGGTVVAVAPAPTGPQPLPNANALERDIISRIKVVQGRWQLTIQQGDSLSAIASALYGDSLSYTTIYNANTNVLNSPNIIDVGTVLVLPQP